MTKLLTQDLRQLSFLAELSLTEILLGSIEETDQEEKESKRNYYEAMKDLINKTNKFLDEKETI